MYADPTAVASWTQNLQNQPGGLLTVAAALCDAQIDGDVGNNFYWPYNSNSQLINNPCPAYIQQMANVLTAATIENMLYAQMQGRYDQALDDGQGNGGSTYGRMLMGMYKTMLGRLLKGLTFVPQLQRYNSIGAGNTCGGFHLELGLATDTNRYGMTVNGYTGYPDCGCAEESQQVPLSEVYTNQDNES